MDRNSCLICWGSLEKSFALAVFGLLMGTTLLTTSSASLGGLSDDTSPRGTNDFEINWIPVTGGLPTVGEYYGVYFGDVNNDGKLDVAAQNGGMHVYVGDGLGNFAEESSGLPVFGPTVDITFADFNNDGKLDIAGPEVYLGNGGEGGSMSWTADTTPGNWNALTAADVNLDGKMDIVAGTPSGVRVWTGDGGVGGNIVWTDSSVGLPASGNFWGVSVGDINHDGKPDIVCADNAAGIKAWTGNGLTGPDSLWTDAYTGTGLPLSESYANVDLGDVNNDGNLDIVSTAFYSGNGVRVWLGNGGAGGSMAWTENSSGLDVTSAEFLGVSLQDIDNDGDLDILAAHYQGGGLRVWLGDGGAGGSMDWTEVSNGLPTGNYIDVDAGDFNNDGKVDFVTSLSSGVQIWQNERPDFTITGYASISSGLPNNNKWYDVIFGDVDNDGKLDIAASSAENLGVRVWAGDGSGTWTSASTGLPIDGNYNGLRFADVNHDGRLDLIGAMNGGGGAAVKVWYGDGTGSWTETPVPSSTPIGGGVEVLDVNHDGNDDIITCDFNANRYVYVYLGNGSGGWSVNTGPSETNGYDDVALGDINHDGNVDLISTSMSGSVETRFWLGDGTGNWTMQSPGIPTTGVYLGAALADVNHDGNLDAGLAGFTPGTMMKVYTSDGGAGGSVDWTDQSSGLPTTNGYAGVEFGDIDLDGNLDIVYANRTGGIEVRKGNGGSGGSMLWTDASLPNLPTTGQYWGIALGDVDNDGLLEIGATNDSGVSVWKLLIQLISAPIVNIIAPDGTQDWSGNSDHNITWNMNDLEDENSLLRVYINYSYDSGLSGGAIAGPIFGGPNPNSYTWTTPFLNATDVTINITVVDTDGYVGYDEELVPIIDSKSPEILSTVPSDGQSDVALDQNITITFDESMNTSSPDSYITVTPEPGGWSWIWSSTTYPNDTLTGSHDSFSQGQLYEIVIGTGAKDDSDPGNSLLSAYQWNFTTLVINTPPSCSVLAPTGTESWTGNTIHTIEWMMADDLTQTENLDVYLNYTSSAGSGPIVALTPSGIASPPFTYDWNVDSIDATDVVIEIAVVDEGALLAVNASERFEIDSTRPAILSTNPSNGESDIARNTNVQATWSEAMNQSATESSFQLFDNSTWLPVPGQVSWISDTFVFDPDSDLAGDNWYTANFTIQAKDDSDPGNALVSTYSWSFRTAPISDILPPEITDVQAIPSPQEVHFNVNVSANITDDFSVGLVNLNVSGPSGDSNVSMPFDSVSGRYYLDRSYDEVGIHTFTIWATDSSGNVNSSVGQFEIGDTTRPTLDNLTVVPPSPEVLENVNISVLVQDNYMLYGVWIDISGVGNFSMQYDAISGKYYDVRAYSSLGPFDFWIWANDTSDNWNGTFGSFLVEDRTTPQISHAPISSWSAFSPLSIEAIVTDNYELDSVCLNYTDVNSIAYNVTMTSPDGTNYSYSVPAQGSAGIITYFIWANDTSGNENRTLVYDVDIVLDDDPPEITSLDANPSPQEVYGYVNISAMVRDDYGLQLVAVNVTWPDSSATNDSMNPAAGDFFYLNRSYDQLGVYSFLIWARDSSSKWNSSFGTFNVIDSTPPIFAHEPIVSLLVEVPMNLTVTVTDNYLLESVRLNYVDVDGVVHNETMDLLSGDVYFRVLEGQTDAGTLTYFFWARDTSGNEARSTVYMTDVYETRPLPPENLTVTADRRGALRLEWDAPTRNDDGSLLTDLRGYNVYRMTESGKVIVNPQPIIETYFVDENLGDGKTYYYVVRAVNSRGLESEDSNEASGTTIRPPADYTWIILLIILIILIVVLLIIWLARRKKDEGEETIPEEIGESLRESEIQSEQR
ncbi:MAG: FG-GAP-like repeat-containing protein [Thermoplasmata archaeon]